MSSSTVATAAAAAAAAWYCYGCSTADPAAAPAPPTSVPPAKVRRKVAVQEKDVRLRASPGRFCPIVGGKAAALAVGSELSLLKEGVDKKGGEWLRVRTANGDAEGWLPKTAVSRGGSAAPLAITTSADLTVDDRFDVIVNSVSPEFQSSGSDSGINFSVWKTLTGYSGTGKKPAPIKYDQAEFAARNGVGPTYADCLWSKVDAVEGSALRYIVHALAPDLSNRPKRLQSGLSKEEAYAALVAVYFRAMWQATVIAGGNCRCDFLLLSTGFLAAFHWLSLVSIFMRSIGMPPLGSGVFANDPADVMSAAALAHAAYCASGGTAAVSVALWSPDGKPPKDMSDWNRAASLAPAGQKNNALVSSATNDDFRLTDVDFPLLFN